MYLAVVFDLFNTLVFFRPAVPTRTVRGTARRTTLEWLREPIERELDGIDFADFLRVVWEVSDEIVRERPPEYLEVPSRERFARAVRRLGTPEETVSDLGRRLSEIHMRTLGGSTWMPEHHRELLVDLRRTHRLGLVSNFDHAETAHTILAREGVADLLDVTVVSAEHGRRKPHPAIFEAALQRLGVDPAQALYVGDSFEDDVVGAHAAGMDVAWICRREEAAEGAPRPTWVLRELREVRDCLRS